MFNLQRKTQSGGMVEMNQKKQTQKFNGLRDTWWAFTVNRFLDYQNQKEERKPEEIYNPLAKEFEYFLSRNNLYFAGNIIYKKKE